VGGPVRTDAARGVHVDTSAKITVAEYARAWSEARVLRPNSRRSHAAFLGQHLEPTPLGSRPIVRVRPSEVQAWVTGRAQVLGPRTVRLYVSMLRSVFAAAALDRVIGHSPVQPAARLSLPPLDRPPVVLLTVAQVQVWADAAPRRVRAMILAQAGLGLRISELRALRVADVDWLGRREVRITAQLDGTGRQRVPLKTARSRRVVPLPAVTAESWPRTWPSSGRAPMG
jgi:integrase